MPEGRASTGSEARRYEWIDHDEDSRASLERYVRHPHIVATLRIAGGPDDAQVGVYIDRDQARAIIGWLSEVVEPDHDERAEGREPEFEWPQWWKDGKLGNREQLRDLVHALHLRWLHATMAQHERTVKAVVEFVEGIQGNAELTPGLVGFAIRRQFNLTEGRDDDG